MWTKNYNNSVIEHLWIGVINKINSIVIVGGKIKIP